jgi:hypothetical protein
VNREAETRKPEESELCREERGRKKEKRKREVKRVRWKDEGKEE